MRDFSLHLLDLLENSLRAGAARVELGLDWDRAADRLVLRLEDDGPGLPVAADQALDPFFSTKAGHRTGLGLPLFRASVEQAAGALAVGRSPTLGGLALTATMQASHLDRLPLGDLATTLSTVVLVSPDTFCLRCTLRRDGSSARCIDLEHIRREHPGQEPSTFAVATTLAERVRGALRDLEFPE